MVSVLIPTFNRARVIRRCVDSALSQTYRPLEIIVVDDGSTDDTRAVLASYGDKVVYIYQENAGLASARNVGLAVANGEYVAFLDSDDLWMPWKLEVQVGIMRQIPDLALIWTDMTAVDPTGRVVRTAYLRTNFSAYRDMRVEDWLKPRGTVASYLPDAAPEVATAEVKVGDIYTPMFMGNLVHPPVAMMRRKHVLRAGGLDIALTWTCEDYEFFWRVAREGLGALVEASAMLYCVEASDQLTQPGLLVFVARGNLVTLKRRLAAERERITLPGPVIRARLAKAHAWLAEEELFSPHGSRGRSVRSFLASIRRDPRHPRRFVLLMAALLLPRSLLPAARQAKRSFSAWRSAVSRHKHY